MDALRRSVAAEKGATKAAPAKKTKGKAKPDDLRRQPQFKFPIEGGRGKESKQAKVAAAPASKAKAKRKSA
jgi:hypothetical protein